MTRSPRFPMQIAVPVSWQPGSTMPDATFACVRVTQPTDVESAGRARTTAPCRTHVLQQLECDESVVLAGLVIVEDLAQLSQMSWSQQMRNICHRRRTQQPQRLGFDLRAGTTDSRARAKQFAGMTVVTLRYVVPSTLTVET